MRTLSNKSVEYRFERGKGARGEGDNLGLKANISKVHYDKQAKGALFNLLKFASIFYGIGSGLKNKLYDKGILKPKKVDAYVVCVGNLTTGGVGKTPVVAQIANYYVEQGEKVAIVSRGYGSKLSKKSKLKTCCAPIVPLSSEINVISDGENIFFNAKMAGDEPFWLAENIKGAVVITCKSRYEGAEFAIAKFGATKIILDDGFQHRKLHRDLDVVLIDSEMGFGNENLLPAGPLREGFEAFGRIDKLVVVSKNTDHARAEKYAKIMGKKLKKEIFVCYTEPDFSYNIFDASDKVGWAPFTPQPNSQNIESTEKVLVPNVVAFSAIGQPKQFYKFLNNFNVLKTVDFDDHHNYTQDDIDDLRKICAELNVNTLITTEKDAGKLVGLNFGDLKVYALKLKTTLDVEGLLK